MRLACLAALLLVSGCTYDLFDDTYDPGRFDIEDVLGTYTGERTLAAPGQPTQSVPATVTVERLRDGFNSALIRIESGGLVGEYVGTYDTSGFYVYGDGSGTSFSWFADGDGFITGEAYAFPDSERRRFTGRLVEDSFDLLIRSPDGTVRDDLRTSR